MHRPFKYISSPIQKLHEHVEEIVGIWCDAAGVFSVDMIQDEKLKELVEQILLRGRKEGGKMVGQKKWSEIIGDIFCLFRDKLTAAERQAIREGFIQNNRIEDLCNKAADPVHYSDLPQAVRQPLKDFFTELYTDVRKRQPFTDAYETLKDYFDKLTDASDLTVCPFCAMNDLKSKYHDGTDAFDHFLPKGTYPFNSINFKNLAPVCHECNSDEKGQKDPLFGGIGKKNRRKAFYPFENRSLNIKVSVKLAANPNVNDIKRLDKNQFKVVITGDDVELIDTWDAVYDIRNRYLSKICQKVSIWLNTMKLDFRKNRHRYNDVEDYLNSRLDVFEEDGLTSHYFLKFAIFSAYKADRILMTSMQEMLNN